MCGSSGECALLCMYSCECIDLYNYMCACTVCVGECYILSVTCTLCVCVLRVGGYASIFVHVLWVTGEMFYLSHLLLCMCHWGRGVERGVWLILLDHAECTFVCVL